MQRLHFNNKRSKNWVCAAIVVMLGISFDEVIDFGDASGSKLLRHPTG